MKKLLVLALMLGSVSLFAQSRGFHSGVNFGIGTSEFKNNSRQSDINSVLAIQGGVSATYNFIDALGIGMDINLSALGSKVKGEEEFNGTFGSTEEEYQDSYRLTYVDVPVYGKLNLGIGNFGVHLLAGPGIQFNLSGKVSRDYDNENREDYEEELKDAVVAVPTFNWGLGLNAKTPTGQVFYASYRFGYQVSELGEVNNFSANIMAQFLSIGYLF